MTIYDEVQTIAFDILREFNQGEVDIIRIVSGTGPAHDPGSSELPPVRLQGATVKGISYKYVVAGQGVASNLQVTMSPIEATPQIKDFVQIDGVRMKIVNVIKKPASGTPVAFVLIVER